MTKLNPLTKTEKAEIKDLANVQYAISKHYDYDPIRSAFWKGRSVGMGKIAQKYNPRLLKEYAKKHGGTYTRRVLSNGFILHRVTVPTGTLKKNPILESLGPAVVAGAGIAIGFKGIDWLAKKMRRRNPDIRLSVRKKVYRGEPGYLVYGKHNSKEASIFFEREGQAREFISRMKAGESSRAILCDIWGVRNPGMTIYCVKCHKKVTPTDVRIVKLAKGRSKVAMKAYKGVCPYCGIRIYRIIGRA